MTLKVLIAVWIVCNVEVNGQQQNDLLEVAKPLLDQIGDPGAPGSRQMICSLADSDRQILIRYYRDLIENPSGRLTDPSELAFQTPLIERRLLFLGDSIVTAARFRAYETEPIKSGVFFGAKNQLIDAARPEFVPLLASLIFSDEPFAEIYGGDTGHIYPKSYTAAQDIVTIVGRSPAFSDETRRWARDQIVPPDRLRPMLQSWWRENKIYFDKGKYSEVKPGVDLKLAFLQEQNALYAESAERTAAQLKEIKARGLDVNDLKSWEDVRHPRLPTDHPADPRAVPSAKSNSKGFRMGGVLIGAVVAVLATGMWLFSRRHSLLQR